MTKEERTAKTLERLERRAVKARSESNQAYEKSEKISECFYMGQPILVGHHSESKSRNAQKKMHGYMSKSIELDKKAQEIESRMNGVGNAILASDDDALELLDKKIEKLKATQEMYKEINRLVKKNDKAGIAEKYGEKVAEQCFKPDCFGNIGIASFTLTNNNANIRRLEKRRESLAKEKSSETTEKTINGVRVVENTELMRIQLFFDGKPDEETRNRLKRNGFRWAPSECAWQRQLNNNGRYAAENVLKGLS